MVNMFVFPFLLHRMRVLTKKFRNQYNISLLWLASIALVFSIDLIEFFLIHDGNLYSAGIAFFQLITLFTCLLSMIQYFRHYSSDGSLVRNIMIVCFMVTTFLITFIGRILSKKSMSNYPNIDQVSPISFHIINTHFFLYYFIYMVFAIVQVYQNLRNKFARCLTNLSYAAWVLGAFMVSFYSEVLPQRPAYDFIHYRNYFLQSTIIVIILQDIHFIRIKLYKRAQNSNINSISLKQFHSDIDKFGSNPGFYDRERKFIEDAFGESSELDNKQTQDPHKAENEEEDTFFDIEEYNIKGSTVITVNPPVVSTPNKLNIQIKPPFKDSKLQEMNRIINNNQTRLVVLFVIILVCELIYITVQLFKSVTFSHFALISPLIHPFTIVFSMVFKKVSCKI